MYDRVRFFHDWDRGEAEISIMKKTYSIKLRVRNTHPMQFQLHQNSRNILFLRKYNFILHITSCLTLYDNIYYIGLRSSVIHKKRLIKVCICIHKSIIQSISNNILYITVLTLYIKIWIKTIHHYDFC